MVEINYAPKAGETSMKWSQETPDNTEKELYRTLQAHLEKGT